jgi:hypothetical protein
MTHVETPTTSPSFRRKPEFITAGAGGILLSMKRVLASEVQRQNDEAGDESRLSPG